MFAKNPCNRLIGQIVTPLLLGQRGDGRRGKLFGAGTDTRYGPQQSLCSLRENSLKMRALVFPRNDADLNVSETAFFQELM
jgi:hypothetical protein